MNFHSLDIDKVFEATASSRTGLSAEVAEARLLEVGPNELEGKKKKPAWLIFLNQFKDFMILVLMAAAIISGIAGGVTDTIIILVIVFLNAVIGFVQEYRAEKAMEALTKMAALQAHIVRGGKNLQVPSKVIVPGDLVLLEAGDAVPADLRLIEANQLRIDESALTGESVAIDKNTKVITEDEVPIGDRLNLAYKGTLVTNGRGSGVAVATGMNTEIGSIAKLLQQDEPLTPLQKRMADFGRKLSYLVLFICLVLFVVGMIRGEPALKMLLLSISLAVAAIPEALPALITIGLARGARRLVDKKALVRKLSAVETLGSVTFICTDKTGTLTQNKMKVVEGYATPHEKPFYKTIPVVDVAMVLNNNTRHGQNNSLSGDPTETALIESFVDKYGHHEYDELKDAFKRVAELPFDSDRKCMTTVHQFDNLYVSVSKGAVEAISSISKTGSSVEEMTDVANQLAAKGNRVLAFAYKILNELPKEVNVETLESELTLAGLVAMIDPAKEEVKEAIHECKDAGIRVVMITGDHPTTASAIARDLEILEDKDLVLTGAELQALSADEFQAKVERVRVYARVSPVQKLDIVKALQQKGHFVSMTGDGVNDAPSLKIANIGVAMGINGTDVSKEAAHMILLDDNFATIVKAVREGRRIYDNIRKFIKYIMTGNGAEIWTIFLAPFIGLPIPLLPIHILWVNLVTDGLPGLALAGEKEEKNIMKRPPRNPNESLFEGGVVYHIMWVGILMAAITLGVQAWATAHNIAAWQTMVFTVLAFSQLGHVMAVRSEKESLFKQGILSNLPLAGAVLLTFILQLVVIYLPFANKLFKTQPLSLFELLICIGTSSIVLLFVELEKLVKRDLRKKT